MNDYSEFLELIKSNGLESIGLFYGCYRGTVISNEDPENLGRIQLKCPALYDDEVYTDWVFPKGVPAGLGSGIFWLPSAGDPIFICCEKGDPRFPLWEYGWWIKNSTIEGVKPGVQVFLTKGGHRIELNDETSLIDIKCKDGFHVKLQSDGIYIGKSSKNLGKFLDDLFQLLTTTTVSGVPFGNVASYISLRTDIAQFLKTS